MTLAYQALEKQTLEEALQSVFGSDFARRISVVPMSAVSKEFCFALLPQCLPSITPVDASSGEAGRAGQEEERQQQQNAPCSRSLVLIQQKEQFFASRGFVVQYFAYLLDENGPVGMAKKETLEEVLQHLAPTLSNA